MLTDTECRNALCPEGKNRVRLTDGGGLYLEVSPNGSKRWFWKYLFQGKEKRLALGSYSRSDTVLKSICRQSASRLYGRNLDELLCQGLAPYESGVKVSIATTLKKMDGRLGRNPLKGALGEVLHAVMCGAGHNLRLILAALRFYCARLGMSMQAVIAAPVEHRPASN